MSKRAGSPEGLLTSRAVLRPSCDPAPTNHQSSPGAGRARRRCPRRRRPAPARPSRRSRRTPSDPEAWVRIGGGRAIRHEQGHGTTRLRDPARSRDPSIVRSTAAALGGARRSRSAPAAGLSSGDRGDECGHDAGGVVGHGDLRAGQRRAAHGHVQLRLRRGRGGRGGTATAAATRAHRQPGAPARRPRLRGAPSASSGSTVRCLGRATTTRAAISSSCADGQVGPEAPMVDLQRPGAGDRRGQHPVLVGDQLQRLARPARRATPGPPARRRPAGAAARSAGAGRRRRRSDG